MKRYHCRRTCSHISPCHSLMDGNASWYSCLPMVKWRLNCENCRHLTVVGLHGTGRRSTVVFATHSSEGLHTSLSSPSKSWLFVSSTSNLTAWVVFVPFCHCQTGDDFAGTIVIVYSLAWQWNPIHCMTVEPHPHWPVWLSHLFRSWYDLAGPLLWRAFVFFFSAWILPDGYPEQCVRECPMYGFNLFGHCFSSLLFAWTQPEYTPYMLLRTESGYTYTRCTHTRMHARTHARMCIHVHTHTNTHTHTCACLCLHACTHTHTHTCTHIHTYMLTCICVLIYTHCFEITVLFGWVLKTNN